MQNHLTRFTQVLLYSTFIFFCLLFIGLPWILKYYFHWSMNGYVASSHYRRFVIAFLYVLGIGGIWMVGELIRIMHTVPSNPFVAKNVSSIRRIGCISLGLALLFVIKCILFFTPFTFICGVVLFICGLLSLVLTQVFSQALRFKQENDLTI